MGTILKCQEEHIQIICGSGGGVLGSKRDLYGWKFSRFHLYLFWNFVKNLMLAPPRMVHTKIPWSAQTDCLMVLPPTSDGWGRCCFHRCVFPQGGGGRVTPDHHWPLVLSQEEDDRVFLASGLRSFLGVVGQEGIPCPGPGWVEGEGGYPSHVIGQGFHRRTFLFCLKVLCPNLMQGHSFCRGTNFDSFCS